MAEACLLIFFTGSWVGVETLMVWAYAQTLKENLILWHLKESDILHSTEHDDMLLKMHFTFSSVAFAGPVLLILFHASYTSCSVLILCHVSSTSCSVLILCHVSSIWYSVPILCHVSSIWGYDCPQITEAINSVKLKLVHKKDFVLLPPLLPPPHLTHTHTHAHYDIIQLLLFSINAELQSCLFWSSLHYNHIDVHEIVPCNINTRIKSNFELFISTLHFFYAQLLISWRVLHKQHVIYNDLWCIDWLHSGYCVLSTSTFME